MRKIKTQSIYNFVTIILWQNCVSSGKILFSYFLQWTFFKNRYSFLKKLKLFWCWVSNFTVVENEKDREQINLQFSYYYFMIQNVYLVGKSFFSYDEPFFGIFLKNWNCWVLIQLLRIINSPLILTCPSLHLTKERPKIVGLKVFFGGRGRKNFQNLTQN